MDFITEDISGGRERGLLRLGRVERSAQVVVRELRAFRLNILVCIVTGSTLRYEHGILVSGSKKAKSPSLKHFLSLPGLLLKPALNIYHNNCHIVHPQIGSCFYNLTHSITPKSTPLTQLPTVKIPKPTTALRLLLNRLLIRKFILFYHSQNFILILCCCGCCSGCFQVLPYSALTF